MVLQISFRPLREAGIKVALLRAPKTVKEVEDQTRNVGQLLGRADKADPSLQR